MKPLFLVSNDDGLHSKGLRCLIEMLRPLGDIMVIVPDKERSGMSTAFTVTHPLYYTLQSEEAGLTIYSCNGTPVDCVKMALNLLLKDRRPDFLFSGINHGFNGSVAIHYSGTMGAVMEGSMAGIPSVGFSLDAHDADADFSKALPYVRRIVDQVMQQGLPTSTFLNVNLPYGDIKGLRVCRQGAGRWVEEFVPCPHPYRTGLHWLTGRFLNLETNETENDLSTLRAGYVSIVPQQLDTTNYAQLERMKSWEW